MKIKRLAPVLGVLLLAALSAGRRWAGFSTGAKIPFSPADGCAGAAVSIAERIRERIRSRP